MDPGYRNVQTRLEEAQKQLRLDELHMRGEASFRAENWQEAVEIFEELRELAPRDGSVVTRLEEAKRQLDLDRLYREGIEHLRRSRWRKAEGALEEVLLLDSGYRDAAAKLEAARESLARSNPVVEILRDPLWQGIGGVGAILALIIAVYPFIKGNLSGLVKPTPTSKPPVLCNGAFEDNLDCWQHGGELDQAVECDGDGCFAVLGNPGYECEGGVPVGEAWINQSFQVPETVSPTLSLKYRVLSYDILTNDLDNSDFFQVRINGKSIGEFGNTEWHKSDCTREAWDSDWQSVDFSLSPYRGERVELSLRNVNATEKWWNTWTYVDDIQVH
jgi:tetratricopeptide (TPR) repeat protein